MAAGDSAFSMAGLWLCIQRRLLPALIVFVLAFGVAVATAVLLPSRYLSTGTILIEQQELPTDIVRSTVSSYATQRIQVISQRVMTTENLLGIVERNNLYPAMRKGAREEIVDSMREDTKLQMISADVIDPRGGGAVKAAIAFSLSYNSPSPQLAAAVANELVSLYLQRNIETRQRSSREAVEFLDREGTRLGTDIKDLEARLAELKLRHGNELPDLRQLNMSVLDRVAEEIRDTDLRIQAADQQLVYLDGQLAQINPAAQIYTSTGDRVPTPTDRLKTLRSAYAQAAAVYSSDHPDVVRMRREIAALEASIGPGAAATDKLLPQQLIDARSQLAKARQQYGADHPDVARAERLVQSLEKSAADAAAVGAQEDPDNPAYISLKAQREMMVNQRKNLEDRRAQLHGKLDDFERRLALGPSVERDYTSIVRDLDAAQTQYRQIRQKQMDAQMSVNLEVERKGERFSLIDPPLVPGRPVSPNRQMIVIFGLIAAIGLASGLIALLEFMDGSVRGRHALTSLLSVPPLAVIPFLMTSDDHVRRRRNFRYAMIGAVLALALVPVLVHFLYRPLDAVWAAGMRRLGG
jgi:polysaccharide biosynthesis transport protein